MEKIRKEYEHQFHSFIQQKNEIHRLWNLDPISLELIYMFVRAKKPKRILEIGTSNGYSAFMMSIVNENLIIDTIEVDDKRYNLAQTNLSSRPNIRQFLGKAEDILPKLENSYDFVFIDANKPAYINYLKLIEPLLESEALIIADNVTSHPETTQNYQDYVQTNPFYTTMLLPVEAGLLISFFHKN